MLTCVLAGSIRIGIRLYFGGRDTNKGDLLAGKNASEKPKKILIVGAGDAGEKTLREMKDNLRLNYNPIGFVDDDSL